MIVRQPALRALAVATLACGALAGLSAGHAQEATPAPAATQPTPPTAPAIDARSDAPLRFIALGDMPYGETLRAGIVYRHLIGLINARGARVAIHVGDIKSGVVPCTDAYYAEQRANFQRFAGALVFTPGDNDWTDCWRTGSDPLERLGALRRTFYPDSRSLGRRPIPLLRQPDWPENVRWWQGEVLFATFHTVGQDNGQGAGQEPTRRDAQRREMANASWIRAAFDEARRGGARALVLASQAEVLRFPDPGHPLVGRVDPSFALSVERTLLPLADRAPFPVLFMHGDYHSYKTDRPFRRADGSFIENLWRLQVFGEPRIHAVEVIVRRRGQRPPFEFRPIWNPLSQDPLLRNRVPRAIGLEP